MKSFENNKKFHENSKENDIKIRDTIFEVWQNIIWIQEKDKAWMLAILNIVQKDIYYQKMDQIDKVNTITTTLQEFNSHPNKFLTWLNENHPDQYNKIILLKNIALN